MLIATDRRMAGYGPVIECTARALFVICALLVLPTINGTVSGAESKVHAEVEHEADVHEGEHGEGHGHGEHAGHDPLDLSAANASPKLEDPAEFRSDLAIWSFVVFGLLMLILTKFAWGPIRDALDARESGIAAQIEEAHRNNEESRRLLSEHETKLAATSDEVRQILDEARKDADAHKTAVVAEAEAAAKAQKDRAVREITAAKNSALEDLAQSSVDQAVGLAGQIMGKKLSKGDHSRLIADAMKQFPSDN